MSEPETILRVAAKGDGITASGLHVAFTAPGDVIGANGAVEPGPHHASPPCRHFRTCGGCELQHLDEESLAQFVFDRVANAASGQGLVPEFALDAATDRTQAPDARVAEPREDQLGGDAARDHLVIDDIWREAGQGQVTLALANDLVARREADQMCEPLDGDRIPIAHQLGDGVAHGRDLGDAAHRRRRSAARAGLATTSHVPVSTAPATNERGPPQE